MSTVRVRRLKLKGTKTEVSLELETETDMFIKTGKNTSIEKPMNRYYDFLLTITELCEYACNACRYEIKKIIIWRSPTV